MGLDESAYTHEQVKSGKKQYRNTMGEWEARETTERKRLSQDELDNSSRPPKDFEIKIEDFEKYKYPNVATSDTTLYIYAEVVTMETSDFWENEIWGGELMFRYKGNREMQKWIDHEIQVNKVKPSKLRKRLNREEKEILDQLKTK